MVGLVAVVVIMATAVAIAAMGFVRTERRRRRAALEVAEHLEARKDYEGACINYAVAAAAGADRITCETKIRALWDAHGPFEFRESAEEMKTDYCRYESCGEGYHRLMVDDIRRIVAGGTRDA